jgi:hypothetical protein
MIVVKMAIFRPLGPDDRLSARVKALMIEGMPITLSLNGTILSCDPDFQENSRK